MQHTRGWGRVGSVGFCMMCGVSVPGPMHSAEGLFADRHSTRNGQAKVRCLRPFQIPIKFEHGMLTTVEYS